MKFDLLNIRKTRGRHAHTLGEECHSKAMTLVEVMVAMAVFALVILGVFGIFIFSMKTMDEARSLTQVTQILNHEMESVRMRTWATPTSTPEPVLKSVQFMAANPDKFKAFIPFGDYSQGDDAVIALGTKGAILDSTAISIQYRNSTGNAAGFTCTRSITPKDSATGSVVAANVADSVEIQLSVNWTDSRGISHTRTYTTSVSKNGINDSIFNTDA